MLRQVFDVKSVSKALVIGYRFGQLDMVDIWAKLNTPGACWGNVEGDEEQKARRNWIEPFAKSCQKFDRSTEFNSNLGSFNDERRCYRVKQAWRPFSYDITGDNSVLGTSGARIHRHDAVLSHPLSFPVPPSQR